MTKANKISIISSNKLEAIIKAQAKNPTFVTYQIDDTLVEIVVNPYITFEDKAQMISDVVTGCFNGDQYQPHYKKELLAIAVFEYFTNIKVDLSFEKLYLLINATDVLEKVLEAINVDLFYDISCVIDDMIEYKKQEILSAQKKELEKSMATIEQYVDSLSNVGKMLENVNPNEVMNSIDRFSKMSSHELATAVLDIRSDAEVDNAVQLDFTNLNQ